MDTIQLEYLIDYSHRTFVQDFPFTFQRYGIGDGLQRETQIVLKQPSYLSAVSVRSPSWGDFFGAFVEVSSRLVTDYQNLSHLFLTLEAWSFISSPTLSARLSLLRYFLALSHSFRITLLHSFQVNRKYKSAPYIYFGLDQFICHIVLQSKRLNRCLSIERCVPHSVDPRAIDAEPSGFSTHNSAHQASG